MKTLTDRNGKIINLMDRVIMPEPSLRHGDLYKHGGFSALVIDFRGSNLIVEDQDSDFHEIEPHRVTIL